MVGRIDFNLFLKYFLTLGAGMIAIESMNVLGVTWILLFLLSLPYGAYRLVKKHCRG